MTSFLDIFGTYNFAVRQALVLILVGVSVYLLLRAGLFAVPQIGFMAVGSYVSALLSLNKGWAFPIVLACGALAAGMIGVLLGALLARLNGIYLAIATIGFSEVVRETAINLKITGGPQGLFGIPLAANDAYIVGVLVAALLVLAGISRSRFGLAMSGIREEPLMTRHQGVDVARYRVVLFGASGVLAGIAGGLYVHLSGFIDPSTYSFDLLIQVLAVVVLGGMTSVIGPVLGGLVVFGLPQVLAVFDEYRNIVNGSLIVLVVAVLPTGLAGGLPWLWHRVNARRWLPRTAPLSVPVGDTAAHVVTIRDVAEPASDVTAATSAGEPLLRLTDVAKHFGGIKALQGVSLDVNRHEVFGIIGPNGSGKTSLLNVLSGVCRPDTGEGYIDGAPITSWWGRPEGLARAGIARTFQGLRLLSEYSVKDNVLLGAYLHRGNVDGSPTSDREGRTASRSAREHTMQTIDDLGLTPFVDSLVGSLPYGLQRKVEIARALVSNPKLLLLDEPTAGMSPSERSEIFDLVQSVKERGVTTVVVEHDVSVMSRYCHRVAVLNFGKTIAVGVPESVMQNREVIGAYIGRPAGGS